MKNSDKPDRIEHVVRNQPFAHTETQHKNTPCEEERSSLYVFLSLLSTHVYNGERDLLFIGDGMLDKNKVT